MLSQCEKYKTNDFIEDIFGHWGSMKVMHVIDIDMCVFLESIFQIETIKIREHRS